MIDEIQPRPALEQRPLPWRVGLIALAADHTAEADFRRLVAIDEIVVHVTRVAYANPTTPKNLRAMKPLLTDAASLALPDEQLDAIVYGNSSGSVIIGEDEIAAALAAGKPRTSIITPAGAAVALYARRIAILTPYVRRTAGPMHALFVGQGFSAVRLVCLGMEDDPEMACLPHDEIVRLAVQTITPGADATFTGSAALRAAQCVTKIERRTGLRVVTGNLAAAWASLRQYGIAPDPLAPSRLFTLTATP
ncbi:maleate cis-trans isomerase family protein [Ciceribacter thiooxidans]|uniref:Ectoine utilization protein EutA n=1 Tax=Ciceribacter thiooxidans TaxID=1969821 RepID=A0ABV7IAA5_9HYPH|nr:ectoine utilization protein EutA [Ciceribacter thiooxidans]